MIKKITSALISVFYKDQLAPIVKLLGDHNVTIYSTGGTQQFIEEQGVAVTAVESLTGFPSVFGGRVKTLHPTIFGGILYRRDEANDLAQAQEHQIPPIDLVIVDLYPFEETLASGASEDEIIEKIDIGGISLIRAAAKNCKDVLVVPSRQYYPELLQLLTDKQCASELTDRKRFAAYGFDISSNYDTAIFNYFNQSEELPRFKQSISTSQSLRYGENPHQKGVFYGNLNQLFDQLHGKELSYNNLLDVDAAVNLMADFEAVSPAYAILKHNNACGMATATTPKEAYLKALQADPTSAFGGVIITNKEVDLASAEELNKLFFEILIAPSYQEDAFKVLASKKNRMLLVQKPCILPKMQFRTMLNGVLVQEKDLKTETETDLQVVTLRAPTDAEIKAMLFANKLVKHTKSNTIVFAVDGQLFASGTGQTSRVDALKQAIEKARNFGFDLSKAVMASDAFFPFPDCVEIAHQAGIQAVIQPGGSIKDKESIAYCDANLMAMVLTGIRHFRH